MLDHFGDIGGAVGALYRHLGANPEETPDEVRAALAAGGEDADLRELAAAWASGSTSEQARGAGLTAWLPRRRRRGRRPMTTIAVCS